jgi:hypothetical protein
MTIDALKANLAQIKEIIRELYIFTKQLDVITNLETSSKVVIDTKEKKLLTNAITGLTNQLKILNNTLPQLVKGIGFYKKLTTDKEAPEIHKLALKTKEKFVQIKYKPDVQKEKVSLTISDKERQTFLTNLSKSNLSINQLKKKYAVQKPITFFGKPNYYAKLSNHFFRGLSRKLLAKGYLNKLNLNLRKINSPFVVGTYTSMIFMTMFITFLISIGIFAVLLFFNVGLSFPFFTLI